MLRTDPNGVIEHIAKNFALWTQEVARSITEHKKDPCIEEARRKSGNSSHGKHGLTETEEELRRDRDYHRRNFYWAMDLNRQLEASKGKGKGKGKTGKPVTPKALEEMSNNDWWYLDEYWKGALLGAMRRAEKKCPKMQTKHYCVRE